MNEKNKTGIDDSTKQKLVRVIKALVPEAKIYLFGSRARGTHREMSDIDIAIDADKALHRGVTGEVNDMLNASDIPYKIDVVDLHSVSDLMKSLILEEGKIWTE